MTGSIGIAPALAPALFRWVSEFSPRASSSVCRVIGFICALSRILLGSCNRSLILAIADRLHRFEQILGDAVRIGPKHDVIQ